MPNSEILTLIISTILIVSFAIVIVYFLFLYQKKRFGHQKEVLELREAFTETLLQSKLEIQEQTLDHIAKELHANFSHLVSLININLAGILSQSTDEAKDNVLETKSLAKQLLSELKALSASLNTDHIMHIGFTQALDNELNRLTKTKKYEISFTKQGEEYRLLPEREIILFRLCQEILNNIVKYANAKSITTTINYLPDTFELEIKDDGIGFNIAEAVNESGKKQSTGMINMQKRAQLIEADITFKSTADMGTSVLIRIKR